MAEQFHSDGFTVITTTTFLDQIDQLLKCALSNFEEVMALMESKKLPFGIGIKNGYKEIVQRHALRYEMPYKMDIEIFRSVFEDVNLKKMIAAILQCEDYVVANKSLVLSLPGCSDQAWHTDGPHMSATEHLPCHCLNVFIPLVAINENNGPTEFRPGSHYYTRDLAKNMLLARVRKQLRPVQSPHLSKGSILLFDYRVLHRGTGNKSDSIRPILVYTFAKSWYKDVLNFPQRSVFDNADLS